MNLSYVYVRQTIILVFYFLCLVTMFIIRPVVSAVFDVRGKAPIYAALYFLPLITFIHAIACGLICKYYDLIISSINIKIFRPP